MTDAPSAAGPALDDPFARLAGSLADTTRMELEVVESRRLTPGMRRVALTAPELAGLRHRPGQDLMLMVAVDGRRPVRRRYSIRALDQGRQLITIDVVRHGNGGPGERWIDAAEPGTRVEGIAPRGKIFLDEQADWHLFAGDQPGLPAFAAMAEALPPGGKAIIVLEVPDRQEEQGIAAAADVDVTWLRREGRPAGEPAALAAALAALPLPPGRGHAYLAGEARVVLRLRQVLADRALALEQISAKAYWGRGRSNAPHGEPPKEA